MTTESKSNLLDQLVARKLPAEGETNDVPVGTGAILRTRLLAKVAALNQQGYRAELIGDDGTERIIRIFRPLPTPPPPKKRQPKTRPAELAMA